MAWDVVRRCRRKKSYPWPDVGGLGAVEIRRAVARRWEASNEDLGDVLPLLLASVMDQALTWERRMDVSFGSLRRRLRLSLPRDGKGASRRVSARILAKTSKGSDVVYVGLASEVLREVSRRAESLGS